MASRWVLVDPITISIPPRTAAVYVFYLDGAVAYIGQTSGLRERLQQHNIRPRYRLGFHTPWGPADRVVLKVSFSTEYGDWAMRELRLIRRLRPARNRVGYAGRRRDAA